MLQSEVSTNIRKDIEPTNIREGTKSINIREGAEVEVCQWEVRV